MPNVARRIAAGRRWGPALAGLLGLGLLTACHRQAPPEPGAHPPLAEACRTTADWIARQWAAAPPAIAAPPWVVCGDLPPAELQRWLDETIRPTAAALAAEFFRTPPNAPVLILLFRDEASFRRHARDLFGDEPTSRLGFYRPHLRAIVVNAAEGPGSLRHELTHALLAFDFPHAPAWLNEGLAALDESATLDAAQGRLIGTDNGRRAALTAALTDHTLPSLQSLMALDETAFHGADEVRNYAQARYFCLFLQRRGRLAAYYAYLRERSALGEAHPRDAQAWTALGFASWDALEEAFRAFLREQGPGSPQAP